MDVIITSASRDKCLKSEMEAFQYYVEYSGNFNFHLHEDVVPGMEEASKRLVEWANESKLFTTIYVSDPRIGRGMALNKLKKNANSKYIFYMEEDFDFIRFVDLDKIIKTMNDHDHVNQIAFNHYGSNFVKKPGGPNGQNIFAYKVVEYNDCLLNIAERGTGQPAIGRRKGIMPKGDFSDYAAAKTFNNSLKENIDKFDEGDPDGYEKNIGAYYYDKHEKYVNHTSGYIRHDRAFL